MYQRILVPIDGSETSDRGLEEALRLARLDGGSVRLIHVVDPQKHVPGYITCAARLCDVVAAQAKSWKADLIVIGSHGRRGVERALLGSDAERILRVAPVPVLLVKPEAAALEDVDAVPAVATAA